MPSLYHRKPVFAVGDKVISTDFRSAPVTQSTPGTVTQAGCGCLTAHWPGYGSMGTGYQWFAHYVESTPEAITAYEGEQLRRTLARLEPKPAPKPL